MRQLLLGPSNPASHPSYTNQFCFRALVPMDRAVAALGPVRAGTRFMYLGPGAHSITYPVAMGTMLNLLAVVSDPDGATWAAASSSTAEGRHIAPGSRGQVAAAFEGWHPTARAVAHLFPDELDIWAIYDSLEHPAATHAEGRVCVAGDAAHAAGPHLGAGAGFAI